jgi:hypothetical protein
LGQPALPRACAASAYVDAAPLSVTITNVIRTGALSGVDKKQPDQVLARLNETFRGEQHGNRYGREAVSSKRESKELEIGADWIRYPRRTRIRDPDRLRREALERSVAAILVLVQGLLKN